jgi:hypothetical protein
VRQSAVLLERCLDERCYLRACVTTTSRPRITSNRLSALAERDLEEIWSYVAEDASPATADRLIDSIIDRDTELPRKTL